MRREAAGFVIEYRPAGDGPGDLTIRRGGEVVVMDRANLRSAQRRAAVLGQLPETARETVEGALLELAQEAGTSGTIGPGLEVLEAGARELVHGTVDLRPRFLLYGFRVEHATDAGGVEEVPVRVLSSREDGGGLNLRVFTDREFEVSGESYAVDSRWQPPLLDDRWNRGDLRALAGGTRERPAPADCYDRVKRLLRRHLDFVDEGAYAVLAAFTLLTYVARAFPAVPYLGLIGPKGSGKSQTLALLARLVLNGYKGRVTAAGLGDTTSALRGTVLVDQAGRLPEELVDLLVDGYRRDGGRRRVVDVDNRGQPHEFETFGPKVLASKDEVHWDLTDRLIVIHTAPAARPVQPLPAAEDEFRSVRGDLYAQALCFWPKYLARANAMEGSAVKNRTEELWRPLRAVLEVAEAPDADVAAARELYRRSAVETVAELGDWELAVLDELVARFEETWTDELEVTNTDLLEGVRRRLGMEGEDHEGPRPGKRWLGTQLDRLNLLDGKERRQVEGSRVRFYRFTRSRIEAQFQRFGLPDSGADRSEDEGVPDVPNPPGQGSGSREPTDGNGSQTSARVPDQSGGVEPQGGQDDQPDDWPDFGTAEPGVWSE